MTAALFAVLLIIGLYVPVIRVFALWAMPLPFIVYVVRNGLKSALPLWGAALVIAFVVGGGLLGLFFAVVFVSGGMAVGELYHRRRPAFAVLFGGSLVYTAGIIVVFILTVVFLHVNVITYGVQLMADGIDQSEQMMKSLGQDPGNRLKMFRETLETFRDLAPAIFILMGTGYALITQLIAVAVLRRIGLGRYVEPWLPFREWYFPKSLLLCYLILLIVGFFHSFTPGSVWYIGYINLLVVLELAVLIQGFAFIFFYFHMKKIHQSVRIIAVIVTFLFGSLLLEVVRILGILDLGFDWRRRLRSK